MLSKFIFSENAGLRVHAELEKWNAKLMNGMKKNLPQVIRDGLRPAKGRLVGFTGHSIWPLGTLPIPFTLRSFDNKVKKTVLIEFVVVRTSSEHNILLGRPGLLKFGAVASKVHDTLKFQTLEGPATVIASVSKPLEYCQVLQPSELTRDPKRQRLEAGDANVVINPDYLEQPIKIGTTLPGEIRNKLITLLQRYKQVFAWKPTDMVEVEREVIEHGLNIQPGNTLVKQKKRGHAGERNEAINKEVAKLVQAGILREAIFPTWIANPVMVKKSNGS
ncbi:hypothetical protein L2E82_37107 [Cichorium intybus]|uniref:Uncharacterized protein n=1 Tax=Cichorium intybus TaxID=13427 RepID=A0ACB9ADZ2_CICIN|nr:hypothetical protein L2E82_37107 [Cichorium intybus]